MSERCIEEPQAILPQPEMQHMLMWLKPFRSKPLPASHWLSRHWHLGSSAYYVSRDPAEIIPPCWKTHPKLLIPHYPEPLQPPCLWVSSQAPVPLAQMCLDWLRLSLFDCSLVQSPSAYIRNKQNLLCWWFWGKQRQGCSPILALFPRLNYLVFPEWPLPAHLQLRAEVGLYFGLFLAVSFLFSFPC